MGRTILVIDDEPELVKLLDYNLTKAGYLVLSAKDGENGLAAARKTAAFVMRSAYRCSGVNRNGSLSVWRIPGENWISASGSSS